MNRNFLITLFAFTLSFALMANEAPAPQGPAGPPIIKSSGNCPGPNAVVGPTQKGGPIVPCKK